MSQSAFDRQELARPVLERLFQRGCLQLSPQSPFTYASGLKGPVYCDNRRLLSYPEDRKLVLEAFIGLFRAYGLESSCVAGMATAGIPHATLIADRLELPMVYVRSKPKGHGKGNQVEGVLSQDRETVLVEDLVNQGKSLLEGISGLRSAGARVQTCVSIVSYDMPAALERLGNESLTLHSLIHFEQIIKFGRDSGLLGQEDVQTLEQWQKDPQEWAKVHSGT